LTQRSCSLPAQGRGGLGVVWAHRALGGRCCQVYTIARNSNQDMADG